MAYIHLAVCGDDTKELEQLLKDRGENSVKELVNSKGYSDRTPMHLAACSGKVEIMKVLKKHGADIYARDDGDLSPMDGAVAGNQIESIKCLKELGMDLEAKNSKGWTPMFSAAMLGKTESIKCLEKLGADVNAIDNNGRTPIFIAVIAGKIESIECLADLGAKLDVMTLKDEARAAGHCEDSEVLKWLLNAEKKEVGFTDLRDNKIYYIVPIGNQVWMAENLAYAAEGSKCYNNDPKNDKEYGRLYDWETAKKACPPGWHLPSDAEWQELVDFAGGYKIAGKKLKAKSGWNENGNGTDDYGFAAFPCGIGNSDGGFGGFGGYGLWWSSSESDANDAYRRHISHRYDGVYRGSYSKNLLFSVRCVRD
jgi:uncharacterized protein (TIGR02145 family)